MAHSPASRPASRIVATIGPASFELFRELAEEGAAAFRLNASHMSPDRLEEVLGRVRAALPLLPVVVDLQGAKMRLGEFPERELCAGERVRLAVEPGASDALPLPHPEAFRSLEAGDTLSCDDDRIRLRVQSATETELEAESLSDGCLWPRKGVNLLEHPVVLDDINPRDAEHVRRASCHPHVGFACSFMLDGSEAEWIRSRAPGSVVIGKVERRGALEHIEDVAAAVDELWICRGDLGAQLGAAELGAQVASFRPRETGRPVLMAGQVLEHLTHHPEPTRSEVCHLHDILARGYAGIVLSDETAIGSDPRGALRTAREMLRAFEARADS